MLGQQGRLQNVNVKGMLTGNSSGVGERTYLPHFWKGVSPFILPMFSPLVSKIMCVVYDLAEKTFLGDTAERFAPSTANCRCNVAHVSLGLRFAAKNERHTANPHALQPATNQQEGLPNFNLNILRKRQFAIGTPLR